MGFLTSNFLNLILTREQNRLQRRLTSVMSQMRTAQKQSQAVEKNINNWLRTQQNMARASMNQSIFTNQANALRGAGFTVDAASLMNNPGAFSSALSSLNATQQQSINNTIQQQNMLTQSNLQTYLASIEQEAELMKEMQLQPLKDLESDLEVEKANIEAELELNKQWKDGAKENIKSGAENLKPNYGSGG